MRSDNPDGAENQQERPISPDWVVGFVDGEGCFSIGFARQAGRHERSGYRFGYQVTHRFAVVQGARSASCLHDLRTFFGVGGVSINRRRDNHKEDLHRFQVNGRSDLLEVVVPFFRAHRLRTSKAEDFELFAECLEICRSGRHLETAGLIEIAERAERMNHRKSRKQLIGILRGHTPDTLDRG